MTKRGVYKLFKLLSTTYSVYFASPENQSTNLRTKSGNKQISVRPLLGQLHEPLFLDQARSTFCEVRGNSATFCLHMGYTKFNTQLEEWIKMLTYTHTHTHIYIYIYIKQTHIYIYIYVYIKSRHTHTHTYIKQSPDRPGVAQRVPGS